MERVEEFTITPNEDGTYECAALYLEEEDWLEAEGLYLRDNLPLLGEVSDPDDDFDPALVHNAPEGVEYKKITELDGFSYIVGFIIH